MATCTCGGEIGGYCAIGNENTASAPASVITMDSTVAKIGRSMKKCDSMSGSPNCRSLRCLRWLPEGGHGDLLGLDLHLWPNLLERPHGDPFALLESLRDHAQSVWLERSRPDAAVLGLFLGVDHVDVFQPLIGADGSVDHKKRRVLLADWQVDAHEHPRR